ncbi:Thioredoxin-like fold protein [Niveomyces insectorum RCEF 264]|uniref:Protein disulfide-isomerase n=1 Tax=Niveomyces insectorum RCEF 264 TaxID=1081102 RepID=A0A167QDB5_9HYPO|nr:Thioredoxin-like fold protein [Niveomyces insectorum RCEF 264]
MSTLSWLLSREACRKLEPEWTDVESALEDGHVVSIDCSADPTLCDDFDVASYPAIRLVRGRGDGRTSRYRGPRHAPEIIAFLRRSLRPRLSYVDDQNITSFLAVDDVVFVAHLAAAGDDHTAARFAALAAQYGDRYSFAVGPAASGGPQAANRIRCFNAPDDAQHTTSDLTAVAALEDFVVLCATPSVVELTRRNEVQYLNMGKSLVHFFYRTEQERRAYVSAMRPLATKYREYLGFTTIDAGEYGDMLATLGLARDAPRLLAVQNPSNGDVFPYAGAQALTPPVVEQFLGAIIQGAVQPWSGGSGANTGGQAGNGHDEL